MGPIVKKFVVLFAMLVIPLQGLAAAVSALQCQPKEAERAAIVQTQETPPAVQSESQPVDDIGTNTHATHFCCYPVSGLLSVTPHVALSDFPAWASSAATSHEPFFPEQPKRPPLA